MSAIQPPAYITKADKESDAKGYNPRVVSRLAVHARPYRAKLLLAVLLMFSSSAAAVAGPYFVKIAIDAGLTARNMAVLRTTLLAFLAVSLVQWVCTYFRINLMARVGQAVIFCQ